MPHYPFREKNIQIVYGTKLDKSAVALAEELSITDLSCMELGNRSLGFFATRIILEPPKASSRVRAHGVISSLQQDCHLAWGMATADCFGLVVINPIDNTIGLLHLGWLQLLLNLPKKFFRLWKSRFTYSPSDLKLFVGPGICEKCFTFTGWKGRMRVILFKLSPWKSFLIKTNGIYSLDLRGILKKQLSDAGFTPEQIQISPECTFESPHLSSHRREHRVGRHTSNIVIVKRTAAIV